MKKKLILSLTLLLICLIGNTQELPKIIPPSPEAAALAKFGEIPISYFTGLPNINIPFYTIEQDGLTIPIGLSYHARGMKVGEIAPRIGMGWALNYGGYISRQTRGKPDESSLRGFNEVRNMVKAALQYDPSNPNSGSAGRRVLFNRYIDGYDFFPDKFMFNANGLSGNFIINYEDLQPLIKEYDDIEITYSEGTNNRIESFIITDSNGNKFYYGVSLDNRKAVNTDYTEISYIYKGLSGGGLNQYGGDIESPFINSWQLMEVITPKGSSIKFYYELEEPLYYQRSYDKYTPGSIINNSNGSTINNPVYGGYVAGNALVSSPMVATASQSSLESYFSKIRSNQYQISEIIFDSGKIKFIKGTSAREDLPITMGSRMASPLDKIQIMDNHDNIVKQFQLNYEYKTGAIDGNELSSLIQQDPTAAKRLFLSSIEETDASNNSNPPYTFVYNDQQVPNRFSNSQDIWGYYNGMPNGEFLTFFEYGSTTNNRTVDIDKSKAGILEKIIYPTGGSTNFVYEHNKAKPSIAYSQVVTARINPLVSKDVGLAHLDYINYYNQATQTYEKQFEINYVYPGGGGGINANVNIQVPNGYCDLNNPNQSACNFSITLSGNGVTHQLYNGSNFINHSVITPGTYTLKVKPQNHIHDYTNPDHSFIVVLDWKEQEIDDSVLLYAGGKRIKRIENRDSNDDLLTFKEYEYKDPYLGGTSGHLFGLPNFVTIHGVYDNNNNVTVFVPTGASPGLPVSSMQGNSVGYEYVTEYYGDTNNNSGKIEYTFMVTPDIGYYYQYPYNLPTDNSWIRGKNTGTKFYGLDENNQYSLKKEITNTYMYGGVRHSNLISNPDVYLQPSSYLRDVDLNIFQTSEYLKNNNNFNYPLLVCHFITGPASDLNLEYKVYHLNGGTQDLMSTVEKDYFDDGTVEKKTTYFYDYNTHYQLDKSETLTHDGKTIETKTEYPEDVISTSSLGFDNLDPIVELPAINRLKTQNRVSEPIQVETTVKNGSTVLSRTVQRTNYKDWANNIVLPKDVQTLKGEYNSSTNKLQDRLTFHSYYVNGNVKEISKKDGSRIVYIWGYNEQFPIAKIENTSYSEVSSQVANLQTKSNTDNDRTIGTLGNEGALRAALTTLRNSLPNTIITTYTYDPLIGVTSITDPRGYTIYYEYDDFNRLKQVKDADGKILSKNEYHYKTQ